MQNNPNCPRCHKKLTMGTGYIWETRESDPIRVTVCYCNEHHGEYIKNPETGDFMDYNRISTSSVKCPLCGNFALLKTDKSIPWILKTGTKINIPVYQCRKLITYGFGYKYIYSGCNAYLVKDPETNNWIEVVI